MRRRSCLGGLLGAGLLGSAAAARAELPAQGLIAAAKASVFPLGTYAETDSPRFTFRGTGFVIGDGRHMLTNAHVLPEPQPDDDARRVFGVYQPEGPDHGRFARATIVAVDRTHDMALLVFDAEVGRPLTLGGAVAEGDAVLIMGYPLAGALGFSLVTHHGYVSAKTAVALPPPVAAGLSTQALHQLREGSFDILQLDATAYPGNSGGPVVSLESGAVVGVLNMVFVKGRREAALSTPSGISYAIPIEFGRALLAQR